MRLYLDMCCLMRPFDDLGNSRVFEEVSIVTDLLELVRDGSHALAVSAMHRSENARNPYIKRRAFLLQVFSLATSFIPYTPSIRKRSEVWQSRGLKLLDSLHLASAEDSCVDVFCTCDDNLLRKAKRSASPTRCLSLRELWYEIQP